MSYEAIINSSGATEVDPMEACAVESGLNGACVAEASEERVGARAWGLS